MKKRLKRAWNSLKDPSLTKKDFKKLYTIVTANSTNDEKKEQISKIRIFNKKNKLLTLYIDVLFTAFENSLNTSIRNGNLTADTLLNSSMENMCQKVFELSFILGNVSGILKENERVLLLFLIFPLLVSTGMFSLGSLVALLEDVREFNNLKHDNFLESITVISDFFMKSMESYNNASIEKALH